MGKEELEFYVKIKYKIKFGRLNRFRKQKKKSKNSNVIKLWGRFRVFLSCGSFSLNMILLEYQDFFNG